MAKAVSIFAVFFVLFFVALNVPKIEAQTDKCKSLYRGKSRPSEICPRLLIIPDPCLVGCITEMGAKGGACEFMPQLRGTRCVCDSCQNNYECSKEYVGTSSHRRLCSTNIPSQTCSQRCIRDNAAKGGLCVGQNDPFGPVCLCDFCIGESNIKQVIQA